MYVTQPLHRALQQRPDQIVTRFGKRHQTFRSIADRIARFAGALRELGLREGDRVAILSVNSDRYLEYLMAVPWAGGVVNPCNIRWSPTEILYSLTDSGTTILLVDDVFTPVAQKLREQSSQIKVYIHCGDGATPDGMLSYECLITQSQPVPDAIRRDDDLLGLFYTGGTTGYPKGVMVTQKGLCSACLSLLAEAMAPESAVYLHAAPAFHLADIGLSMTHWLQGNAHIIIPTFTPEAWVDAVERHGVTHTLLVPTMIQMLLDHPVMSQGRDLSSLKCIAYGASPIANALVDRLMGVLPDVELIQAYGMTELSPLATICPARYHTEKGRSHGKFGSAGRASFCTEVRIVDVNGREVPRGTVGEVAVRGPNVMQGYWNKPELTAEAVRDGWLHTGDGAWMDDDGFIFIVDRVKDMIISGGENIFSAEVENALGHHPAVAASAVIGIPNVEWGEAVHAVVVLRAGTTVTAAELISHCRSLIAGYKCPRSVEFVESLPLSGVGKIVKHKLREPYWADVQRRVS